MRSLNSKKGDDDLQNEEEQVSETIEQTNDAEEDAVSEDEKDIVSLEKEIAEKRNQLESLGLFDIREKKELKEEIEELEEQLSEYKTEAIDLHVNEPSKFKEITPYIQIGDTINYGYYYGRIEWVVLDKKPGALLVISKYAIKESGYSNYREVTWETSRLRNWLNGEFFSSAFRDEEQSRILRTTIENADNKRYRTDGGKKTADKVFLLSIEEAEKYFRSDDERIATLSDETPVVWWLRTPGHNSRCAANVGCDGNISVKGELVYNGEAAVRPAMWIDIKDHKSVRH